LRRCGQSLVGKGASRNIRSAPDPQGFEASPCPLGDRREQRCGLGIADEQPRFGIDEEAFDLGRRVAGVERQEHRSGAQRCKVEHQGLDALRHLHRQPVADPDAELAQGIGEAGRHRFDIAIGVVPAIGERGEKAVARMAACSNAVIKIGH
jgi:hypothetical protein